MLAKLLSLTGNIVMMPLKNLPASIIFLTCFRITVLLYANVECRKRLKLLPKIDDIISRQVLITGDDVAPLQGLQKTANIINEIKEKFPQDIRYKVDALDYVPASSNGPYYVYVCNMDNIAGRYAIIIDEKLFKMPLEELRAILAHELAHIKLDHGNLFSTGLSVLARANEVALACSLHVTIFMGAMNIFSKQKQLPQMITLLALSIMVAKSHSLYKQKKELQADKESLLLNPNGKAHHLISGIKRIEDEYKRREEASIDQSAVRPGNTINFYRYFFSTHPDVKTREQALGIPDGTAFAVGAPVT
jgi:Zn-dependent protease with chaperone function